MSKLYKLALTPTFWVTGHSFWTLKQALQWATFTAETYCLKRIHVLKDTKLLATVYKGRP